MTNPTIAPYDTVPVGSAVTLRFYGDCDEVLSTESVVFLGEPEGSTADEPHITFLSADGNHHSYEWDAYVYDGYWAYGSGAGRLELASVGPVASA